MNILDRIDSRLDDASFRLNAADFEDGAVALLSATYPNLVPITGGTDFGRDAQFAVGADTVGVLVTSSRTYEGVRTNVRAGLTQMRSKSVPIRQIVLVNIAELNQSRRQKLADLAATFDVSVLEIYSRRWFANSLRLAPDWRQRILGLPGGLYALSRQPTADLAVNLDLTVGRERELASLTDASLDQLVTGVPGAGKTHIVGSIPGALFVEPTASPERLVDDLIESDPAVVVLDDAGRRLEALAKLLSIRRAEHLTFRLVATCWPHELDRVRDTFGSAEVLEIDLMTPVELGAILRARGITRDSVLRRVLEQARGRPAWAIRMGDLLRGGTAWNDVMRGHAVRSEIGRYLRNAQIAPHAYETLATIALLGGVTEEECRQLATLRGTPFLDLRSEVIDVAQSGLMDVATLRDSGGRTMLRFATQPQLVAASLAADVYFSSAHMAPHSIAELRSAFPGHELALANMAVLGELLGAARPSRPSIEELTELMNEPWGDDHITLLRHYAALGQAECAWVLRFLLESLNAAPGLNTRRRCSHSQHRLRPELLAEIAGDGAGHVGYDTAVRVVLLGANVARRFGRLTPTYWDAFFTRARTRDIGEPSSANELAELSVAVAQMTLEGPDERGLWAELASRALAPHWEATYMVPDQPRSFRMSPAMLRAPQMEPVTAPILERLERLGDSADPGGFTALARTLEEWVRVARGWALPMGLRADPDQIRVGLTVATRLASALALTNLSEGSRRRLNSICDPLNLYWGSGDPLFEALTPTHTRAALAAARREQDPIAALKQAEATQVAAVVAAIQPLISQGPAALSQHLGLLRAEIVAAGAETTDQTRTVFRYLAETTQDPRPWLEAALSHDLGWYALPLVERMLRDDSLPSDLADRLMNNRTTRVGLISLALESNDGVAMVRVIDAITPTDFNALGWTFLHVTPDALSRINHHQNRAVAALGVACWAAGLDSLSGASTQPGRYDAHLAKAKGWEETLLGLAFPNPLDDFQLEHALRALAVSAPRHFLTLFTHEVQAQEYVLDDFAVWAPGAQALPAEDRTAVWIEFREHFCARTVFWALAGTDKAWIADRLADGSVPEPEALLGPVRLGAPERPPIEDIAELFDGLVDPCHVLRAIPDPLDGDPIEEARARLRVCEGMAESNVAAARAVGEVGLAVFSQRIEEAELEERARLLRGHVW